MRDIVYYLRHHLDRVHHSQEDVALGRIRERDPEMKPWIDRLMQEHRVIAAGVVRKNWINAKLTRFPA